MNAIIDVKPELTLALSDYEEAETVFKQAEAALAIAKTSLDEAAARLRQARINADKSLPSAVRYRQQYRNANPTSTNVVIIKRTGKTIWARSPGERDENATMYRSNGGRWARYPARGGFYGREWIELPQENV